MAVVQDDLQTRFWHAHVRLGASATAVCSALGLIYALGSDGAQHRPVLIGVALFALVTSPLIVSRPVMAVLTGPHREPWLYAWSAALLLAVTAGAVLDRGGTSPIAALFAPCLVFTAMGFGRGGAAVLGAAQLGCFLIACALGSPGMWNVVLSACALAVIAATCATTAGRLRASLTEQERLADRLQELADRDGLTGCYNHRAFTQRLDEEVNRSRRSGQPLGFVMLDLDDFKKANDEHGHVAGDELLTAFGEALRGSVRAGDTVGRLGGDEFAILAPDADREATEQLAERVQRALEEVGAPLNVGVSVGVSILHDQSDGRELRNCADEALYDAKRTNRTVREAISATSPASA